MQDAAGVLARRGHIERGDAPRLGLPALAGNEGRAKVSSASSRTFEDVKVGVRCKIAALWIAMLFLFAYGDIFGFFSPGQIQEVMAGEISGMAITQVFLFAVSLYIAIASVMVFGSLVLSPSVNRWTNIVLPSLYIVSIVASAIGETSAYYWFLSIAESALLLIVWYAWTWPRQEEHLKPRTVTGASAMNACVAPLTAPVCTSAGTVLAWQPRFLAATPAMAAPTTQSRPRTRGPGGQARPARLRQRRQTICGQPAAHRTAGLGRFLTLVTQTPQCKDGLRKGQHLGTLILGTVTSDHERRIPGPGVGIQ